ncbi:hypothetical protein [Kitasatospora sp. SUK 42]|uniref:hypothetical protein n=1 Tax=Kitasatospora sp. SUK 42 TaxID=1588882 RepID=UPI0018CAD72C|nr:hypothetical protein [Kitasatospora sp. SUK 42]MBV2153001.1 hypothetical protein [Kitasatospora sp. SUK 42]
MSGASIGTAQGPTNTGSGDQNIIIGGAGAQWTRKPAKDPRSVALDQRLMLSARFVPPPGFGRLQDGLAEPGRVMLVTGPPGSGRRTAAVMALHKAAGRDRGLVEIPFSDNPEDRPDLAKGDFWLLDLSSIGPDAGLKAWELLGELMGQAENLKIRLAAVLPSVTDGLDLSQFHANVMEISRPRTLAVLRRHLDAEGVPYDPVELRQFKRLDGLATVAMREVHRFARLAAQARELNGAAGVHGWLLAAFAALGKRGEEVARKVATLDSGRKRALFLAAAMLEGARPEALFQHSEALLKRVEHSPDEKPGFERADLAERLKELSAEVGEDGRIRFKELAYGGAVRSHFWTYFPGFRDEFGTWAAEAVQDRRGYLGPEDRTRVLLRFTEESLRTGELNVLQQLAGEWADDPALGGEARAILEQGLTHEQHGSDFRGWIYDQVTKGELKSAPARVLAGVCSEVMAPSHPEQALVRLHHLARRAPETRGRLLGLARSERRLYLRLLGRLCEGLERPSPWVSDVGIFLELVESLPGWVPPAEVRRGWQGVLSAAVPKADRVNAWLSAARQERDGGERLMRILVEAADRDIDVLSRYYLLARRWATEPDGSPELPSRDEVARRFCRMIDRAQGIGPLVGAAGGRGL